MLHLLQAFYDGADGVFVSGCLPGDCHYLTGNFKCAKKVEAVKKILLQLGIESERLEMFYNSSAMGPQFAQTCRDFTETIRSLGPLYHELTGEEAA
jgi:coenzyme F420-reducing hydrogenase delta subunit